MSKGAVRLPRTAPLPTRARTPGPRAITEMKQ
jgi:hypothetical protein